MSRPVAKRPADERKPSGEWSAPEPNYRKGVLARYAILVGSASEGAVLKPFHLPEGEQARREATGR